MTVGELRQILAELPDDMPIITYDHGYLCSEFTNAEVIIEDGILYLLVY